MYFYGFHFLFGHRINIELVSKGAGHGDGRPGVEGQIMHRYVLGLYDMLEKLIMRYPDMLIEGCSGGWRRSPGC